MECEDMDIDSICNKLEAVKTCEHINLNLICDLNIIIQEITKCQTFKVNIYDLCVECGNSLVYDQEYQITEEDITWLKKEGKTLYKVCIGPKLDRRRVLADKVKVDKLLAIDSSVIDLNSDKTCSPRS